MSPIYIIGAGVMGTGVAQCLAEAKLAVVLIEKEPDALQRAGELIAKNIKYQRMFRHGDQEPLEETTARIRYADDLQLIKDAAFVIENITESVELKSELYRQMDELCAGDCIFMVNTSCVSITRIASLVKHPERVIGTHFMNPVPMIAAVEVIRGFYTSDETVQKVTGLLKSLKKRSIVIQDMPGFVSNRISHLMMNEAAFIVQDGVAEAKQVDDIFKSCYGHKMGPLETADLIGLDTVVNSLKVLYESYQDPKFRCCPLLRKMVDAGLWGRKTNKGFYTYSF
ncbi:3-hydroxyacyl-CoA dehydrogenase family protein [Ethanoligenens harbinense]|uniref:3-hydroxyacyl-CoA dehydrogenase NAD-binding protein n=1 Tax=Ethanoligenens harbinense (strain DSM 18485 / JCM 12961 / CGMCC 1.5033 / YUAN-3) TaxID=663278 RepID=E6U7B1_ETHHY|nr:3-hydroxyacyl-CoA dehydrogenase NAD-binding domain-containing protein [Ethanoligenens harbinense]ADU25846.1 3-hydroxyacyl-CoA dehydrogenase NAD-binding protein [Ethanoligenens harbinense YUAN-3]AVQ95007.1 FAD-dependent oxidoreductase [Ethanoligenens harbinense YUAN-3]AYF37699.1 FAD-dependent oxidoreductase [Ethanoligenens harbinense]AYF40419.1 FAD-dependent oxidoreductase [Ethanoligenens harbinense]QCN91254.1 FAD-dependent oxidoreductase [Ethanoligenens harbinense]